MGVGNQDWVDGCAGQVGDCRRSLPRCPEPVWEGPQQGKEKENKQNFPEMAFGARRSQALLRVEAKEPPWINELQGQLGIQLCQKHPLNQASESSVW